MGLLLKLSFVFAVAGHGADLATTEYCLGKGACHELNPWLARFDNPAAFGTAKMTVAGADLVGVYDLSKNHPKLALVANFATGAAFFGIAAHNAHQTHSARP